MALHEFRPGMAPVHKDRSKEELLTERAEEFVKGVVKQIYPAIPEDKVGLIANRGVGVKFSEIRTDASWSIEKQVNVDGRDARPSVHLGLKLKRDKEGNALGTSEFYVAAGGRMMDTPGIEMEPALLDAREIAMQASEEAVLQKMGDTMLDVWKVLGDVAGNIPARSDPDSQFEFARVIREKMLERGST